MTSLHRNHTDSSYFVVIYAAHCELEIVRNCVLKKVKRTEWSLK